jgi:O-acetylhomoserine (thiol)-lyase
MDRICDNTLTVAKHLKGHSKVEWVRYAALEGSPFKAMCDKYTGGRASGILSFGLEGGAEAGPKFIDAVLRMDCFREGF